VQKRDAVSDDESGWVQGTCIENLYFTRINNPVAKQAEK